MSKLPSIFHNNNKFITNNKNSFNTYENKKRTIKETKEEYNNDNLINYFNKKIIIELITGEIKEGTLISKRNDKILLDNGEYINIKDIKNIK